MLPKLKQYFKEFFLLGIDYVLAAGHPSRGMNGFSVTGAGGGADAVLFESYGCQNMADNTYQVVVNGEIAGAKVSVDESTKTTRGFTVLGLGAGEVGHVLVHGQLAGLKT